MQWPYQNQFNQLPLQNWKLDNGAVGGEWKGYANLTWVQVESAGHSNLFLQNIYFFFFF